MDAGETGQGWPASALGVIASSPTPMATPRPFQRRQRSPTDARYPREAGRSLVRGEVLVEKRKEVQGIPRGALTSQRVAGTWSQFWVLNRIRGDMRDERPDAELLSSGLASDFGRFYDRHLRAVTAFVGSWIGQPEVVFDLVAETFARALEHRQQYDPSQGPTVAWLLGIARNLIIDSARRGQVASDSRARLGMGRVELDEEQLEVIADRADRPLREALASLEAVQQEAVIRRVVLEESYRAIAADMRCSEQVVRKRVSRGLARLREGLESR